MLFCFLMVLLLREFSSLECLRCTLWLLVSSTEANKLCWFFLCHSIYIVWSDVCSLLFILTIGLPKVGAWNHSTKSKYVALSVFHVMLPHQSRLLWSRQGHVVARFTWPMSGGRVHAINSCLPNGLLFLLLPFSLVIILSILELVIVSLALETIV